jgi:hypothetical protein
VDGFFERGVVEGDLEGGEAVFTEGAGTVAPGFATFITAEFVWMGHDYLS